MTATALVPTEPILPPVHVEHSTAMVQQMAQAQIQSSYIWAAAPQNKRDWDVIEQQVLKECSRPAFCAIDPDPKKYGSSNAMYGVPRGGEYVNGKWQPNIISGFTIRFAEMCLPYLKSISVDLWPLGEDETQKIYRVVRTDYENNTHEAEIIVVPKTIERRKTRDGDIVVSQRMNSDNKPVFLVKATKEETDTMKAALYSKAKRNLILAVLPGWLKKEAEERIRATQQKADAQDPDAARKRLYEGFAKLGVDVEEIKKYIGHGGNLEPAELEELRLIYAAIAEGQTTWKQVLAAKEEETDDDTAAKLDALFAALEYTPAQIRNAKTKYIANTAKLVEWLEKEVAKKNATGAQQDPTPAVASAAASSSTTAESIPAAAEVPGPKSGSPSVPAEPTPTTQKAAAPAAKKQAAKANASGW